MDWKLNRREHSRACHGNRSSRHPGEGQDKCEKTGETSDYLSLIGARRQQAARVPAPSTGDGGAAEAVAASLVASKKSMAERAVGGAGRTLFSSETTPSRAA